MVGEIFGKYGVSYSSDRRYTRFELKAFLKQFKLNEALRLIGMLSWAIVDQRLTNIPKQIKYHAISITLEGHQRFYIGNVPINTSILVYIGMCLIENARDSNKKIFGLIELKQAANMYYGLEDPYDEDNDAQAALIRTAASQLEYDLDWLSFLSRTIAIYRDIWPTIAECKTIDIEKELRELSGLSFEEMAFLSFWFSKEVCTKNIPISKDSRVQIFNRCNIDKFINWLSCDYRMFKDASKEKEELYKKLNINISTYEKYRFNPLQSFPIIKSDKDNGHVIPSMYLLSKRITQGLYYELSDKFKNKPTKTISFRSAFGLAFEEYIGILLRNSNPNFTVIKSPEYGHKKKGQQKTVDWIVVQDDKAVLIEVKQSGLFLPGKTTGEQQATKEDLKKTLADGVEQIITFEENIKLGKFPELQELRELKGFERLLVTYDPIFFTAILNQEIESILKERKSSTELCKDVHLMWIEPFELIVGNRNLNFYEFLRAKRLSQEYRFQDFNEYISYSGKGKNNKYLSNLWLDLFRSEKLRQEMEILTGRTLPALF
jgi:hypothetical protein